MVFADDIVRALLAVGRQVAVGEVVAGQTLMAGDPDTFENHHCSRRHTANVGYRARRRKRACRPSRRFPTGEDFLPVDLLGKGDEVANVVDSSLTVKRVERPPLLRANAESSRARYLGRSVSAFPHPKPTATAWPGGGGAGHPC